MTVENLSRRVAIGAAAACLVCAAPAQTGSARQAAFERAMADCERKHFAEAYQALWVLANTGHADAARIALLMADHGRRLYGMRFAIGEVQRERWLAAALPHGEGIIVASRR